MCVVIFLKTLSEIRLTLMIIQRDIIVTVRMSSRKSPVYELEFSRHIFETQSNTKFHGNPSSGTRVVPCEGTDRRDEANSLFFFAILGTPLKMKVKLNATIIS